MDLGFISIKSRGFSAKRMIVDGSDGELKRAEQRERGGEKGLETLLTTTRRSGVA